MYEVVAYTVGESNGRDRNVTYQQTSLHIHHLQNIKPHTIIGLNESSTSYISLSANLKFAAKLNPLPNALLQSYTYEREMIWTCKRNDGHRMQKHLWL
jgi:hypothetical protein